MKKQLSSPALMLVFGAFAFFVIFISSKLWGIGVSPDSASYIIAAQKVSIGFNFNDLPSHWPPLYPLVLAVFNVLFGDILEATRIFHALLFAANTVVFMAIVYRLLNNKIATIFSGAFFTLNPYLFSIHYMAWSESLFLFILFISILLLIQFYESDEQWLLYLTSLVIGFSAVTRYAGLLFICAYSLFYLLYISQGNVVKRITDSIKLGCVSVLPLAIWLLTNKFIRNETTNRDIAFHPIDFGFFESYFTLFKDWFGQGLIGHYSIPLLLLTVGLSIYSLFFVFKNKDDVRLINVCRLLMIYICAYTAFIIFSISFVDAYIPVDSRIFVYVQVFLFLLILLAAFYFQFRKKMNVVLVLALFMTIAIGIPQTRSLIKSRIDHGFGYLSQGAVVTSLPLLQFAEKTPKKIYSNASEFVTLHTGKDADLLPLIYSPTSRLRNSTLNEDMSRIFTEIHKQEAVIIFFDNFAWRQYLPNADMLLTGGALKGKRFKYGLVLTSD